MYLVKLWIFVTALVATTGNEDAQVSGILARLGADVYTEQIDGHPAYKVSFAEKKVTDVKLQALKNIPNLISIDFTCSNLNDSQLRHLDGLASLLSLDLTATHITNHGMRQIKSVPKLRILQFGSTDVGDDGLTFLKNCPDFEKLAICSLNVTDKTLTYLAGRKHLAELEIEKAAFIRDIQDNPLSAVKPISDKGMAHLRGLPSLRKVYMHDTRISDAGLVNLKESKRLKELKLPGYL